MRGSSGSKALMYCTRWDMMHLVCLLSNMQLSMAFTRQFQRKITSVIFANNLIISVFLLTGAAKYGPAIRNFINGRNGSFCSYLKVFITGILIGQSRLKI